MELGEHIGKNAITRKPNPFKKSDPNLRKATSSDIVEDAEIIYPTTQYWEKFTVVVSDVLNPSSDWKAFCARDGCRYGLDGAYVVDVTPLYLYKIMQTINNDWDNIPYAIVCARSEDEACRIHPRRGIHHDGTNWVYSDTNSIAEHAEDDWCDPLSVRVDIIGVAEYSVKVGVV